MLSKIRQSAKFSIIAATALPVLLLSIAVFWGITTTYQLFRSTESEIRGLHAIRHLYHATIDLQLIRSLRMQQLVEFSPLTAQQIGLMQDDFLSDFQEADWADLRIQFGIEADVAAVISKSEQLFAIAPTLHNGYALLKSYNRRIEDMLAILLAVTDRSTLVLDPQLDTYYLMDITVRRLPAISSAITELQAHATWLQGLPKLPDKEWAELRDHAIATRTLIDAMKHSMLMLDRTSPSLHSRLKSAISIFDQITLSLPSVCADTACIQDFKASLSPFSKKATEARDSFDVVFYSGTDMLLQRLSTRSTQHLQDMIVTMVAAACAILATLFITIYYSRKLQASYRKLEIISETDPLTGIPNRRGLESHFHRKLAQARRNADGIALGMLDIDLFKSYNDNYGHQPGDVVLQAVAACLAKVLQRGSDYYFRYGGEEFCFFISAQTTSEVDQVCESLRSAISELSIQHTGNPNGGIVTVSIGVVFVPVINADVTLNTLMQTADKLLYQAKAAGRNRVVIDTILHPPPQQPPPGR